MARDAVLIVGFTLFVVLLARFSVHLPFTPVPGNRADFLPCCSPVRPSGAGGEPPHWRFTCLLACSCQYTPGASDGYLWQASVSDYVLGFSSGSSGFFWQMASGGYIIGFVAGAWLVGFLCERGLGSSVWILPVLLAARTGVRTWSGPAVPVRARRQDSGLGTVPVRSGRLDEAVRGGHAGTCGPGGSPLAAGRS